MQDIPLCRMYVDDEIKKAVIDVLDSGWYVKGNNAKELEKEFASYCNAKHGISVSSGTTGLFLAMKAIGIGKGDEVIVPSATFVATVFPAMFLGATPVFVDIDPETNTMDTEQIEKQITDRTKAIVPVHLYGHPANMERITEIAKAHDLRIIEDACQAHGAEVSGKRIGSIGDITCFSFFPSKNMTVAGEGGMVTTNDPELAENMRISKDHGRVDRDTSVTLGFNFRLSELQAAVGRVQLNHLPDWVEARGRNAGFYSELLSEFDGITTPVEKSWAKHAYYVYVIKTKRRDELKEYLKSKGISTGVHYRKPVHRQPVIIEKLGSVDLPNTDSWAESILSLPMDPQITKEQIEYVVSEVSNFLKD